MQIKVITCGSQDFSEPMAALIKMSSRGLLGSDRTSFEKRAGARFVHEIDKLRDKVASDEPLIHLLAIGATEDYGANRNGDGFTRGTCRDYHDSFVKYARFYRDHKNKDPKKSFGLVKLSAYHEPMRRIELVVGLNGSDAAARRNGGLYADKEMTKISAGKEIPVSMACKVAYDVCSYCKNKAPTREDYCDSIENGGHCKAGGLKNHMGSLVEIDGGIHQLHADNPFPTFFDISHVFRPADRIAYVTGLMKAAAHGSVVGGAELAAALGVTIPYELAIDKGAPSNVQLMTKLAYQLAELEDNVSALPSSYLLAFGAAVQPSLLTPPQFYREKFAYTLRALADARICLPFSHFVQLTTGCTAEKAAGITEVASRELPGSFNRLLSRNDLGRTLADNPYIPSGSAPAEFRAWAVKQANGLSLTRSAVDRRVHLGALRFDETPTFNDVLPMEKVAGVRDPAQELADQYALYKVGFLSCVSDSDEEVQLTAPLVVLQNYAK